MKATIIQKGTTTFMIDLKRLVMINAFVRDMTEGVKGYGKSEEFPQTLWHFVILFPD